MRILVVDDHAIVREGLKRVINEERGMVVAGEAGCEAEALDRLRAEPWDVVVLDLNLPGRDGFDLLRDIKRDYAALRVLVLSVHAEDAYAMRALKAGADGYVAKVSASAELVQAIRKVAEGGKYVTSSVAEQLAAALRVDTAQPAHTLLSDREHEVLRLIAAGLTVSEISDKLALSGKTVSTYRARTMEKLGVRNNAQLINYAIKNRLVE